MEKIKSILKENKRWILALFCVTIFLDLLEDVLNNEIMNFDSAVYNFIISFKSNFLTKIFKFITFFGSSIPLISICIISFLFIKNKKIPMYISINLIVTAIFNLLLKNIIRRNRPVGYRLVEETGFSFPSGHSMASMAFYGLIIYLVFKYVKNKYAKIALCTFLSILIVAIGISRIYLGVHYASDVLAGFMISLSYLTLFTHLIKNDLELEN